MSVMIREVETKIVGAFVDSCLKAGYRLSVSLDCGRDIDDMLLGSTDRAKIMEEAFAGDECHIFLHSSDGPLRDYESGIEDGRLLSKGWIFCVFGNDGWDVISDYTMNLEKLGVLEEADKISDHYSGE